MTYITHKFNLTNNQIKKLGSAINDERTTSIKIKKDQYHGEHPLPLTVTELNKIKDGDPEVTIHLSAKKLNHIKNNHEGGFLPLLSLIPLILGGLGAAGGVAGGIAAGVSAANSNRNEQAKNEEAKRHNQLMEDEAKFASGRDSGREGSGVGRSSPGNSATMGASPCYGKSTVGATSCPACGSGLLLKAKKGKGLYLSPYSGNGYGDGLITGIGNLAGNPATGGQPLPQLPDAIANIPLLGTIAKLLW